MSLRKSDERKHAEFVRRTQNQVETMSRDLARVKAQAEEERGLRINAESKVLNAERSGKDQIAALSKALLELRESKVELEQLLSAAQDDAKRNMESSASAIAKERARAKQRVASAQQKASASCQRAEDRIRQLEGQVAIVKRTCNALEQDAAAVRAALETKTEEAVRLKKLVAEADEKVGIISDSLSKIKRTIRRKSRN